jgi:hypothetical protein
MKPWPYVAFELETPLATSEVRAALSELTTPNSARGAIGLSTKPFWGWVDEQEFRLQRVTWSNGFRALVSGRIVSADSGSRVMIRMRLGTIALVVLTLVLVVFGSASVNALWEFTQQATSGLSFAWIPVATITIYVVALWGFWSDANESLRLIEEALNPPSAAG